MYVLQFRKSKSKHFPEALKLAKEFGAEYDGTTVTLEISDLLNAYKHIRTLFGIIQNWRSTSATYNGKPVAPYQFILQAHWIGDCYDEALMGRSCGTGWECLKLDSIKYNLPVGFFKSHRYWYQFGEWKGKKWVINKQDIFSNMVTYANNKGISLCPFFDETKLQFIVGNLPDFLIADGVTFETVFADKYINGEILQVPVGIKHLQIDNIMKRIDS